jgi:hypothetical protein
VQRLEQIRLTGTIGADEKDETPLELEVEPGVRTKIPELERSDDQPTEAPLAVPLSGRTRFARASV